MNTIENHNCAGLCCELYCDEVEEFFVRYEINNIELFLAFCKKHAEVFWRMENDRV
jgi:hypothetical protein